MKLHFNTALMNWLAGHREPWLTSVMQGATFFGTVRGYIVIATLIYVMFDKTLAIRLALLVALTMCFNHMLKIIVKNPRPFIREGNYRQKWAVNFESVQDLASEYSTPSGHAMSGAAFFSYLYAAVSDRFVRIAAVLAILLIGASRPYLGVHYVEDIFLGWAIGLGVGWFAIRFDDSIGAAWKRLTFFQQVSISIGASVVLWAATSAINGWRIDGQPRAFVGYAGIITGIVIARPLELRVIDFDPRSSSILIKIVRFAITLGVSLFALEALGKLFTAMVNNYSMAGYALQYVRYATVGVDVFAAPWIFMQLGLAKKIAVTSATALPPIPARGLSPV